MTDAREPDYEGPFFIPAEAPDELGVTTEQAARALAHPGFDQKKAAAFFRNRFLKKHLTPYGRSKKDKRQPYLFRADQILTAAIYQRMTECGFAGSEKDEAFHAAFFALGSWNEDEVPNPPAPRPSSWVLRGYLEGYRNFGFELIAMRNSTGRGDLKFTARVRHYDFEANDSVGTSFWNPGPTWQRRSLWALDLDPILEHITRDKPVVN